MSFLNRVPQTRGVPWMHNLLERLKHISGYETSEMVAARASASNMGFITSPVVDYAGDEEGVVNNYQKLQTFEPGRIQHLTPGENFTPYNPTPAPTQI